MKTKKNACKSIQNIYSIKFLKSPFVRDTELRIRVLAKKNLVDTPPRRGHREGAPSWPWQDPVYVRALCRPFFGNLQSACAYMIFFMDARLQSEENGQKYLHWYDLSILSSQQHGIM